MLHRRIHFAALLGVFIAGTATMMTLAQDADREKAPPEQSKQSEADEEAKSDETKASDEEVPTPSQPSASDILEEFQKERPVNLPVLPQDEDLVSRRALGESLVPVVGGPNLPEGYIIVDRAGRLTRDEAWWTFSFEADDGTTPDRPIRLLPNRSLEFMIHNSAGGAKSVVFLITGEVTEFKNVNYLLVRKFLVRRDMGNFE